MPPPKPSENKDGPPVGVFPTRRRRIKQNAERVANRVAAFVDAHRPQPGVAQLNQGFFKLQRMRDQMGAKKRTKDARRAPKGDRT